MKKKKIFKKDLKQQLKPKTKNILKNLFKKINYYFFYIKKYPQSLIKAPLFLIFKGPKFFIKKIRRVENIVEKVKPQTQNTLSFNFLKLLNPLVFLKGLKILFTQGPMALIERIKEKEYEKYYHLNINQQYQIWLKKHYPKKKDLKNQKKEIKKFKYQPLISIITPVYNPEKKHLIECLESVMNQSYENWELCLVDDASTKSYVKKILVDYAKKDKRIKVKLRKTNGHICVASNDALKMAKGDYIALLDHDDFLWPNALYEVIKLLNKKPHTQFIYSDEDKLDYDGKTHIDPFFKPDWSPDYLRSINYITHFAVLKKTLVDKIGGFRIGTEGAQDWDLFLRASYWLEKNIGHCHPLDKKNPIQHISKVLYSWRKTAQSTSSEKHAGKVKNYAYLNQKKVLENDFKKREKNELNKIKIKPSLYPGIFKTNEINVLEINVNNNFEIVKNSLVYHTKYNQINSYSNLFLLVDSINSFSILNTLKNQPFLIKFKNKNFEIKNFYQLPDGFYWEIELNKTIFLIDQIGFSLIQMWQSKKLKKNTIKEINYMFGINEKDIKKYLNFLKQIKIL